MLATIVAIGAACAGVAHAAGPPAAPPVDPCATRTDSNYLVADATQTGVIDLIFFNAKGARVVFFECVGDRLKRLGAKRAPATDPTQLPAATTWSCDRLARRFAAVTVRCWPTGRSRSGPTACAPRRARAASRSTRRVA